jgi:hypothetical protein
MVKYARIAVAIAATAVSMGAQAQVYPSQSSCSYAYASLSYYPLSTIQSENPECFSSGALSQQILSSTSIRHIVSISEAISSRFASGSSPAGKLASNGSGMAAGNSGKLFVWANAGTSETDYKGLGFEGMNGAIGVDYALSPNLAIGFSTAADNGNTIGAGGAAGPTISGKTFAPYLGWQISPELTLDATAGFGTGRQESGSALIESDRLFAGANLGYTRWMGNFQLSGKASYFHAEEKFGDLKIPGMPTPNTSAKSHLDQVRVGAQVGYWTPEGIMPFAGVSYLTDISRSSTPNQPWDRDAFLLSVGFMATSIKEGVSANFTYNNEFGRSNSQNNSLNFNLNIRF